MKKRSSSISRLVRTSWRCAATVVGLLSALLFGGLPSASGSEIIGDTVSYEGRVVVIPIKEEMGIGTNEFSFIRRTLKKAETEGAAAIIFDMNTPGGQLWGTAQLILEALPKVEIPTYTYVNPNAISAGALIAIGTKYIYMAPTSAIGAASPVTGGGADLPETMKGKVYSITKAQARSVAQLNGHNPDIAEAFIDEGVRVIVGGKVYGTEGEPLSLSAQEATELVDGKPLLAAGIAKDLEDLAKQAELKGEIHVAQPSGFENVARWITYIAPFLLVLALAGAYLEMNSPGFGIPGIVALIAFSVFFFGHHVAGLAGLELVAIFALGIILLALEIFVFPGTIVLGATGLLLIMGTLLYSMVDIYPSEGGIPEWSNLTRPLINLSLAVVLSGGLIMVLIQFLPQLPAFQRLVLQNISAPQTNAPREIAPGEELESLVGSIGVALTDIRPAGKMDLEGRYLDVVTNGDFIDKGEKVRIISEEGLRLVVQKVA